MDSETVVIGLISTMIVALSDMRNGTKLNVRYIFKASFIFAFFILTSYVLDMFFYKSK